MITAHEATRVIQTRYPHFKPTIGIVLGSGLGHLTDLVQPIGVIPYQDLPGFPTVSVKGHQGNLVLGTLAGVPVVCLQGRSHYYEGHGFDAVTTYIRTLKLLGCTHFLATNAAGSLCEEAGPGSLMLVTDHINLQPNNPLIGANDEAFGPRFYPLDNAYDKGMQDLLLTKAHQAGIALHQGVYIAVTGPHYETAAEIRAFRLLGAHAVGMSTVPEVLLANHCGMKVAVISTLTNYATGLNKTAHSHDEVVQTAEKAGKTLSHLIELFLPELCQ